MASDTGEGSSPKSVGDDAATATDSRDAAATQTDSRDAETPDSTSGASGRDASHEGPDVAPSPVEGGAQTGWVWLGADPATPQEPALLLQFIEQAPPLGSSGGCDVVDTSVAVASYSAGPIDITGAATPLSFLPQGTAPSVAYYLTQATTPFPIVTQGQVLKFTAAGGPDVGAFSGMVAVPPPMEGYSLPSTVSLSAALPLTWTAATSTYAYIWIYAIAFPGSAVLTCRVPDTGSFAIPTAALGLIPSAYVSSPYLAASLYLGRVNEQIVQVGGWSVHLGATQSYGAAVSLKP